MLGDLKKTALDMQKNLTNPEPPKEQWKAGSKEKDPKSKDGKEKSKGKGDKKTNTGKEKSGNK